MIPPHPCFSGQSRAACGAVILRSFWAPARPGAGYRRSTRRATEFDRRLSHVSTAVGVSRGRQRSCCRDASWRALRDSASSSAAGVLPGAGSGSRSPSLGTGGRLPSEYAAEPGARMRSDAPSAPGRGRPGSAIVGGRVQLGLQSRCVSEPEIHSVSRIRTTGTIAVPRPGHSCSAVNRTLSLGLDTRCARTSELALTF